MKLTHLLIFLLIFLFVKPEISSGINFNLPSKPTGFIHRDGKCLKDSNNTIVKLRGVNLGGWLLWEGWIWGDGFKSQTKIIESLKQIAGEAEVNKFRNSINHNFISGDDIRQLALSKFNVVRVPFNYRLFMSAKDSISNTAIGWNILDSLVSWCKKYGIYIILDMHAAPGGQSNFFIADPEKTNKFWKTPSQQQLTIDLWKAIVKRYRDNKTIAGYDLLNEPIPHSDNQLLEFYQKLIIAIRREDKNHLIILEGSGFAKNFKVFTSLPDSNMAFSFHLYTWFGEYPAKKINNYQLLSEKFDVSVWCGEWGENDYDIIKKTLSVFELSHNNISGWAFWTWKKVPNRFPCLTEIITTAAWNKVIAYIKKPKKKNMITSAEAIEGMNEFSNSVLSKNNLKDAKMLEILKNY